MTFYHNFMRVEKPGRPWIWTMQIGRLQVRLGNYQRAIWWERQPGDHRELYNSFAKYRRMGVAQAAARLNERCCRAEYEYPLLAAPDGTVAVPIGDLRLLLNAQGMSASGQDREAGLEAKPASPVGNADAPETKAVDPYALGGGK